MATHIQGATIHQDDQANTEYARPHGYYVIGYTATRNKDRTVTYNFVIDSYLRDTTGVLGTGIVLQGNITINGVHSSVVLKSASEIWSQGSNLLKSTETLSITCNSNKSQEQQTVEFSVSRHDTVGGTNGIVANTGSRYYVIAPNQLFNCYINVVGAMKQGLMWIKDNGVWKQGTPWIKKDGVWKKGG